MSITETSVLVQARTFRDWGRNNGLALVGWILLVAAALKIYGFAWTGIPTVGVFAASGTQLLLMGWELFLSAWLIGGILRVAAWVVATVNFLAFAIVALYLAISGQVDCGCFGVVKVNPWNTLIFDGVILAFLWWIHPTWAGIFGTSHHRRAVIRSVHLPVVLALTIPITFTILASSHTRLLAIGMSRLQGEKLFLAPPMLDVGSGSIGQLVELELEVQNQHDHPIRIIGMTTDCSFRAGEPLPITIPAYSVRSVRIQWMLSTDQPGILTKTAELWTDFDAKRKLRFDLVCRVE